MATIKEDYCSQDVYRLLIEKGFDGEIHTSFDKEGYTQASITLQMAMKWLREVHNIVIGVNVGNENNKDNTDYSNPDRWWYFWEFTDTRGVYREELQPNPLSNEYKSYEEAADAAIKYCLENLI